MTVDVSVLVVHHRNVLATRACLRALAPEADRGREVLVGDNSPPGETGEAIAEEFPFVRWTVFGRNHGYGGALNRLAAMASGRHLLLLNSDVEIRLGCIDRLLGAAEADPRNAATAPRLLNPDGSLQPSARRFPVCATELFESFGLSALLPRHPVFGRYQYSGWPHDDRRRIDAAVGACLLLRRDAFEAVGGFDEGFFLYYEEFDLLKRITVRGGRVLFEPSAVAVHTGAASSRTEPGERILGHLLASRRRWYRKQGNPASRAVLAALQPLAGVLGLMTLRAIYAAGRRPSDSILAKYSALLKAGTIRACERATVRESEGLMSGPTVSRPSHPRTLTTSHRLTTIETPLKRRRLLILVYGFPPDRMSGAEMGADFLAREAIRRGWDARVVVTRRDRGRPTLDRSRGYPVRRLTVVPVPLLRSIFEIAAASVAIVRERPDLIHGQALFPCGWLAAVWGRLLGIPSVCYLYGRDVIHPSPLLRDFFGRWTLGWIGRPLAATAWAADRAREILLRDDLAVVHSGFDWSAVDREPGRRRDGMGMPANEQIILFVGRLIRDKGVDLLLNAFDGLDPAARGVELWITGRGPLERALRTRAARSRAPARIRFLGGIPNDRLGPVYRSANLFVLPSRVEPFGVVLLEAMAFGLPVVATRTMGVPELVADGESGRLVAPGDRFALTRALADLLDDPDRRRAIGDRNRTKAAGYGWTDRFAAFDRIYRGLLGEST